MGASSPAGLLNPFQGPNGQWYEGDKLGMGAANAVLDAHLERLKEEHEEARARRIAAEARRDNVLKLAAIIDEWKAKYEKLDAQYDRLLDQACAWREVAIAKAKELHGPLPPKGDPRRADYPMMQEYVAARDRNFAARVAGKPVKY